MKVLLCNPPAAGGEKFTREGRCTQEQGVWGTLWPPVSIAMTAAVLEQAGHTVRAFDCPAIGMSREALRDEIDRFLPKLVVWSSGTPSIAGDLDLAAVVKGCGHHITTAVFGTHVTALDGETLQATPALDCIIRNEPELTTAALAAALDAGNGPAGIAGLTYRDADGTVRRNQPRPFVEDLDRLPLPAWHLLDTSRYVLPLKGRPFLIVAPLRGCPFSCSFCTCQTYYGRRVRTRSPERVLREIAHDIETFGVRDFFFWAETFVVDREYVAVLCRAIIESGLEISWTCNSRVDTIDRELLELMFAAGCWMISFGIESASQAVLEAAAKGVTPRQAREAVDAARSVGIKTAGHFIFGLPGDTPAGMAATLAFARSLKLDIAQFYGCVPFPGSRLYEQAVREGWISGDAFSSFTQSGAVMELPGLPAAEVERMRARAFRSCYCRPAAMLRVLRLLRLGGIGAVLGTGRIFRRWAS